MSARVGQARVGEALGRGEPLRVVFLNDTGYIGGAGIAQRRQVQSFLMAGHAVGIVCWLENEATDPPEILEGERSGRWLGLHAYPHLHVDQGWSEDQLATEVSERVFALAPDLVIAGNLHWARWPLSTLNRIREGGGQIVAYLHDCHWITGRCAYPSGCEQFRTGCDERCPTPHEYPPLEPDRIALAWRERRNVFGGLNGIPMVANSRWLAGVASKGYRGEDVAPVIHLGLDSRLFVPFEKDVARRLLGVGPEHFVVLLGAVDVREERKGGGLLGDLVKALGRLGGVEVLLFGAGSETVEGARGMGLIRDERVMPIVFNAADVVVNLASQEAFGQTMMESSACGTPIVAMRCGGVADIARDGLNAILMTSREVTPVVEAVAALRRDRDRRLWMGQAGRKLVEQEFTLRRQYERWREYLLPAEKEPAVAGARPLQSRGG